MATFLSQSYPPCIGTGKSKDCKPSSPFRQWSDEICYYRDIECTEKEKIRTAQHSLKVYQKSTLSSRARTRKTIRQLEHTIGKDAETKVKEVPSLNWALTFAKCVQSDKQSIVDYINEQKELFLLEYRVKVKQNTMKELEKLTAKEERRAKLAETKLEEDTLAFEEFLRENDRSSANALKMASQETKAKLELTAEVTAAMNEVFSIKSDIAIAEDTLRRYISYEIFLMSISPQAWREKQLQKRGKWKSEKKRTSKCSLTFEKRGQSSEASLCNRPRTDYKFFKNGSKTDVSRRPSLVKRKRSLQSCPSEKTVSSDDDFTLEDIPSDVEPEIYFKDPEELLQMFAVLEEENLTLFQSIQDIVGTLDDSQQREKIVKEKIEQEIKSLVDEKEAVIAAYTKEGEKSAELALKAKMFSTGQYNPETMDKILHTLHKKVAEVYKVCGEETEVSSLTTLQMLQVVEIRVSEFCEMLESIPTEYISAIEATGKLRMKERRQRLREEKLEELKRNQEERAKLALARAIAAPKKREGRKLVYRSQPPETKQGKKQVVHVTTRFEDDYYFT